MQRKFVMTGLTVAILLLCLPAASLTAQSERVYRESNEKETITHRFRFEKKENSHFIFLETEKGGVVIRQTYEVDQHMATRSWSYDHPGTNTLISAVLRNKQIVLNGRDKGKPVKKTYEVDEAPWNQTFNIGLEPFAQSGPEKTRFWAIGTGGPGNMKITKFKVKKEDEETITLEGREVRARHVSITLPGLLSIFWTGHYYYRIPDGRFLRYRGKNGPGEPPSTMNLISETSTAIR